MSVRRIFENVRRKLRRIRVIEVKMGEKGMSVEQFHQWLVKNVFGQFDFFFELEPDLKNLKRREDEWSKNKNMAC